MRKVLMVTVVLLVPLCLACAYEIGAGLDLGSLQDLVSGSGGLQLLADMRATITDDFQVRLPLSVTVDHRRSFLESGVFLVYYPWRQGLFMGLSLFQFGFSSGCRDLQNMINLNEVIVGWTQPFGDRFFVEGSVSVRDPSGTFTDEYSQLKGTFPCYTTFRVHVALGWYFWRINE